MLKEFYYEIPKLRIVAYIQANKKYWSISLSLIWCRFTNMRLNGSEQVHQVRFERHHIATGLSFQTEGQKSKGNSKKQAQRLRRVSPCFSYNNKKL